MICDICGEESSEGKYAESLKVKGAKAFICKGCHHNPKMTIAHLDRAVKKAEARAKRSE